MNIEINLHPNYRICSMSPIEITEELSTWTRDEMIAWLCWSNPKGIYIDREAIVEYGDIIWRNEAIDLILYKIDLMNKEG
ncbi:hypothetical protein HX017_15685 [Myroides marinus]|uniref:Uncharacterized protein n=1 Tax=Myroides marinus TaxID=703342 RepID=A0A1H6WST4_9FLAO|nr:hypothetical protein [Myroides marinus]MDM1348325.1 hypothetical protein [Myroides marinus]MDM1351844.1 hypothetical protein [Myroides marinus]MDM1355427.1 hypothetical protein [Myroides marinus]MDM1359044.1 hypothetical protein [Myroides marinus]MDM1360452.1 hypothetical protein [Myroides marinus]